MKILIKADTEYKAGGKVVDGYMGAPGWEGANSSANLDNKGIAKVIRSQFKKKFPGYKISAKSDLNSINIIVWIHQSDLMDKATYLDETAYNPWKYKGFTTYMGYQDTTGKWVQHDWLDFNGYSDEKRREIFSQYYDYCIDRYSSGDSYPTINYGAEYIPVVNSEPIDYVYDLMQSFKWDDSNVMVDYHSTNFYGFVSYAYD